MVLNYTRLCSCISSYSNQLKLKTRTHKSVERIMYAIMLVIVVFQKSCHALTNMVYETIIYSDEYSIN